jgi:hypothetical protein
MVLKTNRKDIGRSKLSLIFGSCRIAFVISCAMLFLQHLDSYSYRFYCSELESVEIFGKKIQDGGDI